MEGRVCHKFKVPDRNGRLSLTLATETSKTDEGITTEMYREDNTEVEIHASSLETFVQTDKPIYKPGETVRFRVMTIDRDLKPWVGVVPLVTIKNPGDVRVRQWRDVENKLGLLSFDMALSEDPSLGIWVITLLVEGKEHKQPFTVQEYVLPKYEVSVTAPKFLLPTSETIDGTVCAKYTYGKPVKGKVEVSVCYTESRRHYFYYYRQNQQNRPCAKRILDINGCESFTVDGSELYLDSSNFSRYGNLEIKATVTEEGTGISLNGSVTGPEMTFEAVKMKFKDDTHGYFKDAFPYYARVIVTKPDGSPVPGEIVEISADNYNPDFHLKRNFTSDQNGIVKFAIKTLPKDVNRLSFNARAPKYYEPYGRYHYIVKMYEPRAYHYANKWFSPSNSYIHIPAVERRVECGSTLDLDVLYSTPPDTDYKFFIQVLSKSHMVYHNHARHHFKIHDAVNFDGIPEDMLLDPYTPPPRPTYYYPVIYDDVIEDDPELGYKPPAENITITVDGSEKTGPCQQLSLSKCMMPLGSIGQQAMKKICKVYRDFLSCIEPFRANCEDEGIFSSISSIEDTYSSLCKNPDCDLMEVSKCSKLMVDAQGTPPKDVCKKYEEFKTCMAPHLEDCKDVKMFKSIENMLKTYTPICGKEDETDDVICTGMYKSYPNTTVVTNGPVTASNTQNLRQCADVCTNSDYCRGFTYQQSAGGSCELFRESDYTTREAIGSDYYERNCYFEGKKDVQRSTHIGKVKLSIPITAKMGPESQLLVYYVREDEETVAATLTFKVKKCFDNKVEMKFDQDTVYPGNDVSFNLKASPGSLCSVGVVDKSINLLGGDHQLTPEKIFGRFKTPYMSTSYWQDEKKYCDRKTHYDPDMESPGYWTYRSYKSDSVDAIQAFRKMNLVVFTDLTLETRPCEVQDQPIYYHYKDDSLGLPVFRTTSGASNGRQPLNTRKKIVNSTKGDKKSTDVRSQFPETWLWDLYIIGDDGEIKVTSTIPHTITEWVGNSLCTNIDVGVGVSPVTGITAFQPFFLSFTLPYSAIRGEIVPVLVSIFNYMSECLVMQVSLPPSSDFGVEGGSAGYTRCVCPGETNTVKYHIIPYTLGKIKILAAAESIPDDGTCGNNAVSMEGIGASDAVQRELLIDAEGIEKEYTLTSYICPEGNTSTEEMVLPLPSDNELVDDSARGYINVIGDIMGPALSNLKDLLQMPYGCGEQNMASFSPNIFALQYLTNTNQLLPKIEEEAKGYMRIGYQRQLKYRHTDGSYSAFGGAGSGSIWLTSFVIKCLGQSRPYIDIDDEDLTKSISWFRRKQLENGCFPKIGYTHSYYLKGGFSDRSNEASLTAFVLVAMLEAGIPPTDPSIVRAVRCLDVQDIPDTYTLSLIAYAYTLYDLRHLKRQHVMDMLEEKATVKDGMKFWSRTEKKDKKEKNKWHYTAVSAEVEMTAYALLAHITGEQQNAAINAKPIVMWLTKQRNPRGGFSSTQDTIVALQALARYATLVYQGGVNISVDMIEKAKDSIGKFNIDDYNTLVLQSKPVKKLPTTLEARVTGTGCAMIQTNVKYNVYEAPTSPTFDMAVKVYRAKDKVNHCGMRTLSICVRFTGPGGVSNMAIVDVKMVTGWIPVKDSLKKLIVGKDSPEYIGIEKYELDGSYVHIYFDQFDNTRRCFLLDVEQNIELSNPKPAQVTVYDYYETDFTLIVNYDIKTICGTKEELPYISPEEYYSGLMVDNPVDNFVQIRIPFRPGDTGRFPGPMSCPICMTNIDPTSKAFKSMVCGSKKIYKVKKGRKGAYPLKIYANLRPKKKEPVHKFVKQMYDSRCKCDLMKGKAGKILVFSEDDTFDKATKTLALNSSNKILKRSKTLEKAIWKLVRRKKCN